MAGRIFINYRRGDDPGFTGWLRERLEDVFAADRLFMDVDSIAPGLDFVRVLEDQVDKCDVFLAVIGPRWLDARDQAGNRRLDNPDDFVRIEIESSLKLGKRIIPVLVNNADMPRAEHLPEGLKPLARRNAVRLTHERFKADAQGLIKALEKALEEVEADRQAANSAAAAEAERRKIEEAAKAIEAERQEKERARLQSVAGLSPEQIAKAEELANWEFIKESQSPQDFRDHLARFPKGTTERMARAKLEVIAWRELDEVPGIEALEGFLAEFADGKHASEARSKLDGMRSAASLQRAAVEREERELAAWNAVKNTTDANTLQAFLREWPNSAHAAEGRRLYRALKRGRLSRRNIAAFSLVAALGAIGYYAFEYNLSRAPSTDYTDGGLAQQPQPVYPSAAPEEDSNRDTALARQPQPVYPSSAPENFSNSDTALARQPQPVYPSGAPEDDSNTDTALARQPQPVYPSGAPEDDSTRTQRWHGNRSRFIPHSPPRGEDPKRLPISTAAQPTSTNASIARPSPSSTRRSGLIRIMPMPTITAALPTTIMATVATPSPTTTKRSDLIRMIPMATLPAATFTTIMVILIGPSPITTKRSG